MTATNHGLMGSIIAITLQKYPAAAIALAPLTHFLLDAIPHFGNERMSLKGKKFFKILGIDMLTAVVSTLFIAWAWSEIWLLIIVCAFLSASPDLMWIYYEYINPERKTDKIARFHTWIQWSETPQGKFVEIIWFIIIFPSLLIIGTK